VVYIRLSDPPLAGNTFVNQRLAVGGEGGDLGFDAAANAVLLRIVLLNLAYGVALNRKQRQWNANKTKLFVAQALARCSGERRENLPLPYR